MTPDHQFLTPHRFPTTGLTVIIHYKHEVKWGVMRGKRLPARKTVTCRSRELHQSLLVKLNRMLAFRGVAGVKVPLGSVPSLSAAPQLPAPMSALSSPAQSLVPPGAQEGTMSTSQGQAPDSTARASGPGGAAPGRDANLPPTSAGGAAASAASPSASMAQSSSGAPSSPLKLTMRRRLSQLSASLHLRPPHPPDRRSEPANGAPESTASAGGRVRSPYLPSVNENASVRQDAITTPFARVAFADTASGATSPRDAGGNAAASSSAPRTAQRRPAAVDVGGWTATSPAPLGSPLDGTGGGGYGYQGGFLSPPSTLGRRAPRARERLTSPGSGQVGIQPACFDCDITSTVLSSSI